ncbi:MAG: hypothetical protein ABIR47_05945, partial [Candidatus Kapaibacterium sp.]
EEELGGLKKYRPRFGRTSATVRKNGVSGLKTRVMGNAGNARSDGQSCYLLLNYFIRLFNSLSGT